MRQADFGHFDGPVVLFGGPYSNRHALVALNDVLEGRAAVCTGDIVGYCAEPIETVALLADMECHAIAGNCERQLAENEQDCGCGFEPGSACDRLSSGWWPWLSERVGQSEVAWLNDRADIGCFTHAARRYAVIHGGAMANNTFIWPSTSVQDFEAEIRVLEEMVGHVDGIIAGHSGIAFHRRIGGHDWINPGVIGLPPHDGRVQTRYAVLDDGGVTFHRLCYDHSAARRAMEAVGLTQGYHETLSSGVWPSEDILPLELRR